MSYQLDTLACRNCLRGLPPWQKLGLGLATLFISLFAHWLVHLAMGGCLAFWTISFSYAGIPWRFYQYSHRYGYEVIGGCIALVIGEILYRSYV